MQITEGKKLITLYSKSPQRFGSPQHIFLISDQYHSIYVTNFLTELSEKKPRLIQIITQQLFNIYEVF